MSNQPDNTQVDYKFPAYEKPWPVQWDKCEILKNKPIFPLDALPTQHYMYHVPSKWSKPDNTQELDEILDIFHNKMLALETITDPRDEPGDEIDRTFDEAKQAILDWHNKQVKNAVVTAEDNLDQYWNKELDKQIEGVLDKLEGKTKTLPTWESTSMVEGFDVLSAIEAERNKPKGER